MATTCRLFVPSVTDLVVSSLKAQTLSIGQHSHLQLTSNKLTKIKEKIKDVYLQQNELGSIENKV